MFSSIKNIYCFIISLPSYFWAIWNFRGYKPQPVTFKRVILWLSQFKETDRKPIIKLLHKVIYISEKKTEYALISLNQNLLERLSSVNITLTNIIYVQVHDPGSSSGVMLNMLRDRGLLERKGCHFIDSKDIRKLYDVTSKLEHGAIIYVDDFAATGDQFRGVRDYFAQYIVGTFSEFFLLPCVCEEAIDDLGKQGVEPIAWLIHTKDERPLHSSNTYFDNETKTRLVEISKQIDPKGALGYKGIATMIVFYRNTPNTTPVILRGCIKQHPWVGILPRTTDLN